MPAPTSSRTLWKGAISFGLVHIPVTLHSATAENRMKFNLLNKETMTRVGNKQVDKATGEATAREEIVKGFEVEKDQYVVLTPDEIKEVLLQTAIYCGVPAANSAFAIAQEVLVGEGRG